MGDISLDLSSSTSNSYQDFLVQNGDLVMTSDLESGGTDNVLQDCVQSLRWITPEWFLDIQGGVPWFQQIFTKNADQDQINAILLSVIQNVPGVIAVISAQFTPQLASKSLVANFSIQRTTGIASYSGVLDY